MARPPDVDVFLSRIPQDGSPIGNMTLRDILGWSLDKYLRVRQRLLVNGEIELGRGRGGSVFRTAAAQRGQPTGAPAPKQLPANPYSVIPIFPLASVTLSDIDAVIDEAPKYGGSEFRELVCNTIGAIHQIPILFYRKTGIKFQLKQVEAYFGRSSCGGQVAAANLIQRLRAGTERGHNYGMVFAKTSIQASLRYERHGIRLLQVLHETDGLCISNNSFAAVGKVGAIEPGFLYMTFCMLDDQPKPARELTKDEIKTLVLQYRADLLQSRTKTSNSDLEGFEAGLSLANNVNAHGAHRPKLINYEQYE